MRFLEEYIGRIVVLLTPVFAGFAGAISVWAARNLPGAPALDAGELTAVFVTGAGFATSAVLSWLKGRREYEARRSDPHEMDGQ
jgi:hypothetical protein